MNDPRIGRCERLASLPRSDSCAKYCLRKGVERWTHEFRFSTRKEKRNLFASVVRSDSKGKWLVAWRSHALNASPGSFLACAFA